MKSPEQSYQSYFLTRETQHWPHHEGPALRSSSNLITSQRPCLRIPLHWGLVLPHMNFRGNQPFSPLQGALRFLYKRVWLSFASAAPYARPASHDKSIPTAWGHWTHWDPTAIPGTFKPRAPVHANGTGIATSLVPVLPSNKPSLKYLRRTHSSPSREYWVIPLLLCLYTSFPSVQSPVLFLLEIQLMYYHYSEKSPHIFFTQAKHSSPLWITANPCTCVYYCSYHSLQ